MIYVNHQTDTNIKIILFSTAITFKFHNNLYINLAVVRLSVRLSVRHVFSSDRGSAKGPRILTKPSPKWKLLSPKQIEYALSIARARVHAQRVKTCTLFLPTFLVSFLTF